MSLSFERDVIALFEGSAGWHMDPYLYSLPRQPDDPVRGAELLGQFQNDPAYYLYDSEVALLQTHATAIAGHLGERVRLIDYGPGPLRSFRDKVLPLLRALEDPAGYLAIDLCERYAREASAECQARLPEVAAEYAVADFYDPSTRHSDERPVVCLLGNAIANLHAAPGEEAQADTALPRFVERLAVIREQLGARGRLLVSHDTNSDEAALLRTYGGSSGAAFIVNIFARIKRDLELDEFDATAFESQTLWRPDRYRIECRATSLRAQRVRIGGRELQVERDQSLHVSNSHKYPAAYFLAMAEHAGLSPVASFFDEQQWMAVHLLERLDSRDG